MVISDLLLCFDISQLMRNTFAHFNLLCDSNLFPCSVHSLSSWIIFLLELGKPWPLIADVTC